MISPAPLQKDGRHGQSRQWFEADDTPLLAEGRSVVPAPPECQQCQQPDAVDRPNRLPHYRKYRKFPQRVRNAIESLMSMIPPPHMTGHLPSHSRGEERPAVR